jgi:hypothetical protein
MALDSRPHLLLIRYAGRTYEIPFRAGALHPEEPAHHFPGAALPTITISMQPVYLFDQIGGIPWLCLPPWLLTCLLLTPPLVRFLRRLLHIA